MNEVILTGLDIGSSMIRLVVGQAVQKDNVSQLNIIGVVEVPSQGVSKGSVVSIEDAVSSLSAAIEKAERMIGLPIKDLWVAISGTHIKSQESLGVVAISRATGEIQDGDVERVIDQARSTAVPVNYEIIHIIPRSFSVDNQTDIKDPVGMSGIKLEVSTQVIRGLSPQIKNLTRCIHRVGVDINDLILSNLAAAEAVLTDRQKEVGVAVIDIGATTTNLVVFEDGELYYASILAIGSNHITSDLAIGLRTALEVAERVKIDAGHCLSKNFEKKEEINLQDFGGDDQAFSKKFVAEIVEARTEEIFQKVDEELQKIHRSGLLPAGIMLVGGGAKLPGIVEVGKRKTMLPVSIGTLPKFNTAVDRVGDVSFATALGLVMWGYQSHNQKLNKRYGFGNKVQRIKDAAAKVKDWIKALMS
ncbi:MAG: cell division protein FtsA [Candidatus Falkowbacteria bacterium]